jgi:two-component system heavy metal sensor histidine kinase CusS
MGHWRHSITLRLSLAFALLATLVFAALGAYLSRSADAHMAELDAHELLGKLALARHVGSHEPTPAALAARLGDALIGEHGVLVAVDGEKGAIFEWPDSPLTGQLATAAAATGPVGETPVRLKFAGRDYRVVAGNVQTAWGETARVVVGRDIRHHTDFLDQLQRDFWLALLAAALLTVVIGILIARHGMHPVRAIAHTAGQISAGQLAARIPEADVPPELAELATAFNAMLGRLEESFQRLSDFSADLAHELRTPIHTLRMQTEVSLAKPRSDDDYRDLLASNLEEYERLSRMIADMLFLAKAEHGLIVPQREAIPLLDLGRQLFDYYGILADSQQLTLEGEELSVHGDRLMLQRAIGNLLLNAIQHTPAEGRVALSVRAHDGAAVITVSNTGPAIPEAALRTIFERFIRADQSGEGSGLGLAIAKSIVVAHGGSIAANSSGQLTEFAITLPLAGPAAWKTGEVT